MLVCLALVPGLNISITIWLIVMQFGRDIQGRAPQSSTNNETPIYDLEPILKSPSE